MSCNDKKVMNIDSMDIVTMNNSTNEYDKNAVCVLKRLSNDIESFDSMTKNSSFDQSILFAGAIVNVLDLITQLQSSKVVLKRLSTIKLIEYTRKPYIYLNCIDFKASGKGTVHQQQFIKQMPNSKNICGFCHKSFPTISNLHKHMIYCGTEPNYFCKLCSFETQCKKALISHLQMKHKDNAQSLWKNYNLSDEKTSPGNNQLNPIIQQYCTICDKYIYFINLSNNCPKCNNKMNFRCAHCKEQFGSRERATHHSKFPCPQNQIRCSECIYVTSLLSLFSMHMIIKHPFKPLEPVCGKCLRKFQDIKKLKVHWRTCEFNLTEPYSQGDYCNVCKKKFKNIKSHLHFCRIEKSIKCMQCSFRTKYSRSLERHMKKVHSSNKPNKMELGRIKQTTFKAEDISKHQKNLTLDTKYLKTYCSQCSKIRVGRFNTIRCKKCKCKVMFRCHVCDADSQTREDLILHLKKQHFTNNLEKNYSVCTKCGKTFALIQHLKMHEKVCGTDNNVRGL